MIFTVVNSGSKLGWMKYHQWLRICSESEGSSVINRKLKVPSEVDDTHYGQFRVPTRLNEVPQVKQGLQWVRRLEEEWQEAQSAPDPMESIRPQTRWKKIESKNTQNKQDEINWKQNIQNETRWKWTGSEIEMKQTGWEWKLNDVSNLWNAWSLNLTVNKNR